MTTINTPDWVKDAVFYQIFPDTFARGNDFGDQAESTGRCLPRRLKLEPWNSPPSARGYKGGNLWGVIEHLDYLVELGITAIYFCPIFQSASNHRYHTHDYFQVDPMLGGNQALARLLDAAHVRGIRVVLDGVFNHASRGFFQFHDICENGLESAYVDWFEIQDHSRPLNPYDTQARARGKDKWATNYRCWWNLPALPEFNTANPEVREFLWSVATHWIKFGIDGWRLDVPECITTEGFWEEFRNRVKAINPDAYLVGEIWRPAPEWLAGDRFDALMNYVFSRACLNFFGGAVLDTRFKPGGFKLKPIRARGFARAIAEMLAHYDWEVTQVQLNLLGSHDTPRVLSLMGGDHASLRLATLFQMTMPGAPCIYYGDEVGLASAGSRGHEGRVSMPWEEESWDRDLLAGVKEMIALRKAHPALRRGKYRTLHFHDHSNSFAFLRHLDDEKLVVIINNGKEPWPVKVRVKGVVPDGAGLETVLGSGEYRVQKGSIQGAILPPRGACVLLVS